MLSLLFIVLWLACSLVSCGFLLATLQSAYPEAAGRYYRHDLALSVGMSLLGPLSLVVSLFVTGFWSDGYQLLRRKVGA